MQEKNRIRARLIDTLDTASNAVGKVEAALLRIQSFVSAQKDSLDNGKDAADKRPPQQESAEKASAQQENGGKASAGAFVEESPQQETNIKASAKLSRVALELADKASVEQENCGKASARAFVEDSRKTLFAGPSRLFEGSAKLRRDSAPAVLVSPTIKARKSTAGVTGRRRCATDAPTAWRNRFRTDSTLPEKAVLEPSSDKVATVMPPSANLGEQQQAETKMADQDATDCVEGESWPEFLARCRQTLPKSDISAPEKLFEVFRTTTDLSLVFATFAQLFHLATAATTGDGSLLDLPPWAAPEQASGRRWRYPYEPLRLLLGGNWKAKRLWQLLDTRLARPEYKDAPCEDLGQHALVVGAGPCGLRAAIELRMLGLPVTVVEKRTKFSRINQLHLWSWCGEDLRGLGARCIEPPPSDFGSNPDLLHISISDLQVFLMKVALLLGAEIVLGCEFCSVAWHGANGFGVASWQARLSPAAAGLGKEGKAELDVAPSLSLVPSVEVPSARAPTLLDNLGVLIVANGFDSNIGQDFGMKSLEKQSESAIGIICNFARTAGKEERRLRSFSLARQFYVPLFKQVEETTGAELENIVYVKGHSSHYFVMTPTVRSLVKVGVVKDNANGNLLARDNVDQGSLERLVRSVAAFPLRGKPSVLEALAKDLGGSDAAFADAGPRVFDFSKTRRMAAGLVFAAPPSGAACDEEEGFLLTAIVGDALIEPFWPEGLGVVRGFFATLDACASVLLWAQGASRDETELHFEEAYLQLKTLSAATRARVVRKNEAEYRLPPDSRYRQFSPFDGPTGTISGVLPSLAHNGKSSRNNLGLSASTFAN